MLSQLKFHHMGVATASLERTISQYQKWGYFASEVTLDSVQKVRICFMSRPGFPLVELLEPAKAASPINNILAKSGTTPYHVCYEIPDIGQSIEALQQQKYILLQEPVSAPALGGCKICFLFHQNMGLIELVESSLQSDT